MEWTIYTEGPYALRCVEDEGTFVLRRLTTRGDSVTEVRNWRVDTLDGVVREARQFAVSHLSMGDEFTYTEETPDVVLQEIRENLPDATLSPVETSEDNIFADVDELSTDEKRFLDSEYRSKMELPDLLASTNRVTTLFASAGFATAVTWYNATYALVLGVLSALVGVSLLFAIPRVRTELTATNAPAVHDVFMEAVESVPHVGNDEAKLYAVKGFVSSPFTLPIGGPNVYLPDDMVGEFTEEELQAIMQHELGHHKNIEVNLIAMGVSVGSTLLVAPLLVAVTPLSPDKWLFAVLVVYLAVAQGLALFLNRKDEETADDAVSQNVALTKALIRLSPSVYHVNSTAQSVVHRLFDVHPPMNKRVEKLLGAPISVDKGTTWSIASWLGAAAVILGSFLIGYGFLSFTPEPVPESYIFYGTILMFVGVLPQYYATKGKWFTLGMAVLLCVSFGITLGIGFLSGADSIIGAVAQGKIWRQVVGLGLSLVIVAALLFSTACFDVSPDAHAIEEPAEDWYTTIDD